IMTATTGNRRMSRAEVIERARGIAVAVAPQVERAEQLRRMPPENVKAMMDSGLMPLMRPARFGGGRRAGVPRPQCLHRGRPGLRLYRMVLFLPPAPPMDLRLFPGRGAKTRLRVGARSEIRRLLRAGRQGPPGRGRLGAERGMALGLGRRSL